MIGFADRGLVVAGLQLVLNALFGEFYRVGLVGAAGFVEHLAEFGVVVRWVVVEEDEVLRSGQFAELERLADGAVAPALACGVLRIGELTIVDQQIGVFCQIKSRGPLDITGESFISESGLVVGDVGDGLAVVRYAVPEGWTGMADVLSFNREWADLERLHGRCVNVQITCKVPDPYRKEWW